MEATVATRVSPQALCLLFILQDYARSRRFAWPSQGTLADRMGRSERAIRRYIGELLAAGLIRTERKGLGKPNHYFPFKAEFEADATGETELEPLDSPQQGPELLDQVETPLEAPEGPVGPILASAGLFEGLDTQAIQLDQVGALDRPPVSDPERTPLSGQDRTPLADPERTPVADPPLGTSKENQQQGVAVGSEALKRPGDEVAALTVFGVAAAIAADLVARHPGLATAAAKDLARLAGQRGTKNPAGKVVAFFKDPAAYKWNFAGGEWIGPAGKVKPQETSEQRLARQTRERKEAREQEERFLAEETARIRMFDQLDRNVREEIFQTVRRDFPLFATQQKPDAFNLSFTFRSQCIRVMETWIAHGKIERPKHHGEEAKTQSS